MRWLMRPWRAIGRFLGDGVMALGTTSGLTSAPDVPDGAEGLLMEPPPGHPERLIPHIPLSSDELRVWDQLNEEPDLPADRSDSAIREADRFRRPD
jgi:hypothetical protein